ncbi:hypothetical protein ACHAXA_008303 [Cyclostephanos tholiformis]|uniref:Phosphoglycerate mutase-like protein n=1 Tax=Cyclostephanos tholiformis TaxID=382380 RepID=A0ABD3RSK4_9STRA
MMIRHIATQPQGHVALLFGRMQSRSQGTAAIARHTNEQIAMKLHHEPTHFNSTIRLKSPINDFSSLSLKRDDGDYYFEAHSEAFFSALKSRMESTQYETIQSPIGKPRATDMDLVEAPYAAKDHESYDKILVLMRHGEAKHNVFEREYARTNGAPREKANDDQNYPVDPSLTGKGCGQMLDVSRRTAIFFNKETGLQPDLVVVSPLRRAIQAAIISFPTYTAPLSLSNTPWICHPLCMEQANGNKRGFVSSSKELKQIFTGVDFTLLEEVLIDENVDEFNSGGKVPLLESKIDLMRRTNEFLTWIKNRDERVIVVSSHATWLHSLCAFSLQYESGSKDLEMFKKGELRSVGIKFQ